MSELPANVRYRGRVASGRRRKPPRKLQSGSGFFWHFQKNSKKSISKTTWEKNHLLSLENYRSIAQAKLRTKEQKYFQISSYTTVIK